MHIGFITPEYPHQNIQRNAGIGTSIKNLASGLVRSGIQVTVFVYSQDKNEELLDSGIHIYKIRKKKYPLLTWYFYRKSVNSTINHIVKEKNIELLEIPDWTGISAFMKFSCKTLIKIHGSDTYFCHLENRKQKYKNYFFERKAFKNSDQIVAVSKFSAKTSKKIFNSHKEIEILPNLVDTERFRNIAVNSVSKELLYFGSVIRKKGVLELAEIFNGLVELRDDITLKIIGKNVIDVIEKTSTLSLFKNKLSPKAKKKFIYVDKVAYQEIVKHINNATAIILPSFAEALPMSWLEAMSCSKVLFASDIGWSKEIIEHTINGYALNPKSHASFANLIHEVIDNEELMSQIGSKARETIIKKFSEEVVINKHVEFYSKVIKNEL
tara:strand:+ start:36480 stop:37625 length:1146 start_codon:yes stop_codon:yes gene_type:complete